MWILYILKCRDNSLYTGITTNLQKRVEMHLRGKGAKYTRGRGPFDLVYTEHFQDRSQASQREYVLKRLTPKEKLNLIEDSSNK